MEGSEGSNPNTNVVERMDSSNYILFFKNQGTFGVVAAVAIAIIVPLFLSVVLMGKKKAKQRGVLAKVGGEAGLAMRNAKSAKLIEVPWEGATTVTALFEKSCRKHSSKRCLGTRKLVSRDFVTAKDGRKFEKLHLDEYNWESYGQIFDRACNFASGLVNLGHDLETRAAIFSETRAEWIFAFQVFVLSHFLLLRPFQFGYLTSVCSMFPKECAFPLLTTL